MGKYPKPSQDEIDRLTKIVEEMRKLVADTSEEQVAQAALLPATTVNNLLRNPLVRPDGHWRIQTRTRRALTEWGASLSGRVSRHQKNEAVLTLVRYIEEGETSEERGVRFSEILNEISRRSKERKKS